MVPEEEPSRPRARPGLASGMIAARSVLLLVALGASLARGDVVTTLSGSQLTITGDDSPDWVAIDPATGGITVTGVAGTLVDGSAEPVTFSGVTRLTVKLGPGADRLTIRQVTLDGPLVIGVGKGNDSVELDQVFAGN